MTISLVALVYQTVDKKRLGAMPRAYTLGVHWHLRTIIGSKNIIGLAKLSIENFKNLLRKTNALSQNNIECL